jgi:hypothetical protein
MIVKIATEQNAQMSALIVKVTRIFILNLDHRSRFLLI